MPLPKRAQQEKSTPGYDCTDAFFPGPTDFDADAWFATPELRSNSDKNLLEIVISWEGVILDIGHYSRTASKRIAFGSHAQAEFNYPIDGPWEESSPPVYFPLFEPVKNGFLLCFYPEMDGTIEENGEHFSFLDLVKVGRAHCFDRDGRCYYPLLPGVVGQLHCNGLEIQFRYVSAPQFSLQWSRHLGSYAPVLSFSVLTHLLMALFAILSTTPPIPASKPTPQQLHTPAPEVLRIHRIQLKPVRLCIKAPTKKPKGLKKPTKKPKKLKKLKKRAKRIPQLPAKCLIP